MLFLSPSSLLFSIIKKKKWKLLVCLEESTFSQSRLFSTFEWVRRKMMEKVGWKTQRNEKSFKISLLLDLFLIFRGGKFLDDSLFFSTTKDRIEHTERLTIFTPVSRRMWKAMEEFILRRELFHLRDDFPSFSACDTGCARSLVLVSFLRVWHSAFSISVRW